MTEKEFHEILKNVFRGESAFFNLSPYWIFIYNWDIVRIVEPQSLMPRLGFAGIIALLEQYQFPPIGNN